MVIIRKKKDTLRGKHNAIEILVDNQFIAQYTTHSSYFFFNMRSCARLHSEGIWQYICSTSKLSGPFYHAISLRV